jgi:hypothetical protein
VIQLRPERIDLRRDDVSQQPDQFAVIYDPENGFRLLNTATNEVADMAVLEGTWRKMGESPSPEVTGHAALSSKSTASKGVQLAQEANAPYMQKMVTMQYGTLRIRSMGTIPYAIADPRVSLRDDQS